MCLTLLENIFLQTLGLTCYEAQTSSFMVKNIRIITKQVATAFLEENHFQSRFAALCFIYLLEFKNSPAKQLCFLLHIAQFFTTDFFYGIKCKKVKTVCGCYTLNFS